MIFHNCYYTIGQCETPLNEDGIKQAQAAGQALKKYKFHHAISSDLQRAFKTCQLILKENQTSPVSCENIEKDKLLRERNFGFLEGKGYDEVIEFVKKYGEDITAETGESGGEVEARAREFLKSLIGTARSNKNGTLTK